MTTSGFRITNVARIFAGFILLTSTLIASPTFAAEIHAHALADDVAESPTDERTWALAESQPLVQRAPTPNGATEFATSVRVLAAAHHLYLRVQCLDPHPPPPAARGGGLRGSPTS